MVVFHSYVSLPEGNVFTNHLLRSGILSVIELATILPKYRWLQKGLQYSRAAGLCDPKKNLMKPTRLNIKDIKRPYSRN
jgi:hypothetical protein